MNIIEIIARGMASKHKTAWDDLKPETRKHFEDAALAAVDEMNKSSDIERDMTVAEIIKQAVIFKLSNR